jgi:uncharacterized protein
MKAEYDSEAVLSAFQRKEYGSVFRMALPHAQGQNPDAQCTIALLYEAGLGVKKDVLEAERWLLKATEQNSCLAWHNLGTMYAMGHVELKPKWGDVLRCYQKAKDLGFNMGNPYPPPYLLEP